MNSKRDVSPVFRAFITLLKEEAQKTRKALEDVELRVNEEMKKKSSKKLSKSNNKKDAKKYI